MNAEQLLTDLYAITDNEAYLDLAQNYLDMSKVKLVINRSTMKAAEGMKNDEVEEQFRYEIYARLVDDWDLNVKANSFGQLLSRNNPQAELVKASFGRPRRRGGARHRSRG